MSTGKTEIADERVAVATRHWGPRFVAQGVDLNDFNRTLPRIKHWDDWCREWGVTATEHEQVAEAAEGGVGSRGFRLRARRLGAGASGGAGRDSL
jgi:hypothetical protein